MELLSLSLISACHCAYDYDFTIIFEDIFFFLFLCYWRVMVSTRHFTSTYGKGIRKCIYHKT